MRGCGKAVEKLKVLKGKMRSCVIKNGVYILQDIFGPLIDLNFIKNNPIAFIDSKEVEEAHAAPPHVPPIK